VGRRAVVVVLDACGAGALPDAADYGDAGTNTLGHLAQAAGGLDLPALQALGLGSILPLAGVPPSPDPVLHGRLHPLGPGKDSTSGHWELMGVVPGPTPTYPHGFPPPVVAAIERIAGRGVLCNAPSDGIGAIERHGAQALAQDALIVYTSQDSVLQIAAHEAVVPVGELYEICGRVRELMSGEHAVGRVIARPFGGEPAGGFERTPRRRDFALAPPAPSHLDALQAANVPVHAVGKVAQLFAGRGIDAAHPGATNAEAIAQTTELLRRIDAGLVFANLIETDQVYGHRKDVAGFHAALQEIDAAVARWLALAGPDDLVVLTADHGCDPLHPGTDHTREHAPLLASFAGHGGRRHDGPLADVGASVLRWLTGRDAPELPGTPFCD
jgi:phosphopentomutase